MSRRLAREISLQTLFQLEFSEITETEAFATVQGEHTGKAIKKSVEYAAVLNKGVLSHKMEIDDLIGKYAKDWDVTRIACVDMTIMRIALYEMLFSKEQVDFGVAINEALEIAKVYGSEETTRFINGILGKIAKTLPKKKGHADG